MLGEYRVLSAYMMTDLDASIDWIFNTMDNIFKIIESLPSEHIEQSLKYMQNVCANAINNRMPVKQDFLKMIKSELGFPIEFFTPKVQEPFSNKLVPKYV